MGGVTEQASPEGEPVRAAEIIGAACLATDVAMGFPFEHGLHGTLMAMRLADLLDVDPQTESQTYYASLLMYSGCTTDSDEATDIFGGSRTENLTRVQHGSRAQALAGLIRAIPAPDDPSYRRIYDVTRRLVPAARFAKPHFTALCEVAEMMAKRLGMPPAVHHLFAYLTDRWDGKGMLKRAKGDELPMPVRIVHVARDAAYQRVIGGDDHAVEAIRRRAGHAFDPVDVTLIRRAGFVHDLGRVAIDPRIWQKPTALTVDDWEQVRLHPYHTERVLLPSSPLASLAEVAAAHHERLDGTGYHRRMSAASLGPHARLLAAADAFHAMGEPRPHRGGLSAERGAEVLSEEARTGHQDSQMVAAVIEAAGQPPPSVERPAGLTEREAEVVGLLARGLQTKQVARRLGISTKTADRHIQNVYRKIGVSTRAAATMFAMEHGLVAGRTAAGTSANSPG